MTWVTSFSDYHARDWEKVTPQMRKARDTLRAMSEQALIRAIEEHRGLLWGLCYRMSGCAADADDWVQDTVERALANPPKDTERDLKPWLVRVAVNLSRDHLRRRKRRGYVGPWLPGPAEVQPPGFTDFNTPASKYRERETVTVAFLLALEALSPSQRAVLMLRDVLGYSVREAAEALDIGEPNVKTTHHRARAAMANYDERRAPLTTARLHQHREALQALLGHLKTRNVDGLEALLCDDVRALNDSDGEFFAARRPVEGRAKVILFHLKIGNAHAQRSSAQPRFSIREMNGEPVLVADMPSHDALMPVRSVMRIVVAEDGRIREIDTVVATRKLMNIQFDSLPSSPSIVEVSRILRSTLTYRSLEWIPAAGIRAARAFWTKVSRRY